MTNALKAIKATGMSEKVPVWMHTATDHSVLKPLGLEAPEGVMGTMDYHFYHPDTPANRAFVKAFQEAYGNPPGFPAFHAYVTAHLIAKAFNKAGAVDRERFIDSLEGMKVDSPVGEIEMRACDHQVLMAGPIGEIQGKSTLFPFPFAGTPTMVPLEKVAEPPRETGNPRCAK